MKKLLISFCVFGFVQMQTVSKSELTNVQILPFTTKAEIMQFMKLTMVKELGVKCNFCHDINDYSSDKNEHKVVAREMIKMVNTINSKTMQPLKLHDISCWNCHRGKSHPEHQE